MSIDLPGYSQVRLHPSSHHHGLPGTELIPLGHKGSHLDKAILPCWKSSLLSLFEVSSSIPRDGNQLEGESHDLSHVLRLIMARTIHTRGDHYLQKGFMASIFRSAHPVIGIF